MAGSRRSSVVRDQWSADQDRDPRPRDSRRSRGPHRGERGRGRFRDRGGRHPRFSNRPFDNQRRSPPAYASRSGPDSSFPPVDAELDRSPPRGSPGPSSTLNDNRIFDNPRPGPRGGWRNLSPGPMDRENNAFRRDVSPSGPPSKRKRTRSPSPRDSRGPFPSRRGAYNKLGDRRDRSPPPKGRGQFLGRGASMRRSPHRGRDRARGKDRARPDYPPVGRSRSPGRGRGYPKSRGRRSQSLSGDDYSDRDSRYRSRSASRHSIRSSASKISRYSSRGDEPLKSNRQTYSGPDDRSLSPRPSRNFDESRMDRFDEPSDQTHSQFSNRGKRGTNTHSIRGRRQQQQQQQPPLHDTGSNPPSPHFTPTHSRHGSPQSPYSGDRGGWSRKPSYTGPGRSSPHHQDNYYSQNSHSAQSYKVREDPVDGPVYRDSQPSLENPVYRSERSGQRGNHATNGQDRRFSGSSRPHNNGSSYHGGRAHFNNAQWTTSESIGGQQSPRADHSYGSRTPPRPSNSGDLTSPHGTERLHNSRFQDRNDAENDRSRPLPERTDEKIPLDEAVPPTRESDTSNSMDKKGRFSFAFKRKTSQAPAPKPVPDLDQRIPIREPAPRAPTADPPTPRNRLTNGPMPKFKPDPPRFDRRDRDRGGNRDRRDDRRHPRDSRDPRDSREFRDPRDKRDDRRFDGRRDRRGRGDRRPDFRQDRSRDLSPIETLREQFREPWEAPTKKKKIITVYKPRPTLSEDFAQADSVYYRKPGNESVIGAGTYGKVFKGIHVYTQRQVALKKIRMEGEKDGFPVTAVREIKLLQHLRNHNVVNLLEVMVERNECFMVFEYLSHDLTGLINHPNFNLTLAHKKDLAKQMFEGLNYLHYRGVLHRDIKAANILISNQGLLKFADFGLARFFSKSRQLDYTNRVITIWYRPPELLLGETRYGPAVDVWSAACVCMEMFTKKAVFPGEGGEISQLDKLYNSLGTPTKVEWPDFVEMPWFQLMRPTERKKRLFEDIYREILTPQALDMISSVFQYDPAKRPTAEDVLKHPYFTSEEPAPKQAIELENMEGDWHEFESKALRKEARRAEYQTQKDREKRKAEPQSDRDPKRARQEGEEQN